MPITRISHKGQSWPIEEFVQACLSGSCSFPAPVAATILENHREYSNRGTISGSQLHKECDYSTQLEKLPYTKEIGDMFWATYRGSNVHSTIEKCRDKPEFKDWIFEERFFAILAPDDSIDKLEVPRTSIGKKDWSAFTEICEDLVAAGYIILSGQVDTYDTISQRLLDWKTARTVGEWTKVKQSWQQQMNQYALVLDLNGHPVKGVQITVMDATMPICLDVPLPDMATWAGFYLVPRVRYLDWLQDFTPEQIQAINDGEVPPPLKFPKPTVNYLCNESNREGKSYCPFRHGEDSGVQCPAWKEQDLTAALEASVKKVKGV